MRNVSGIMGFPARCCFERKEGTHTSNFNGNKGGVTGGVVWRAGNSDYYAENTSHTGIAVGTNSSPT